MLATRDRTRAGAFVRLLAGGSGSRGALVARLLLWAALYGVALGLGRWVRLDGTQLALVWPAAAVAVLWLAGSWERPRRLLVDVLALAAVTALGNAVTGAGAALSAWMAPTNVVHAVVAVLVVRRLRPGWGWSVRTVQDVVVLLAGAVAGAVASAALGALALATATGATWWDVAPVWLLRNASSTFVLTLLVLLPRSARRAGRWPRARWGRVVEGTVLAGAAALAYSLAVVVGGAGTLALATLPLGAWVGTRFAAWRAAGLTALGGGVVIALTWQDHAPFAANSPTEQVVLAQALAAVTVLVTVLLAVHRDERHALIDALRGALAEVEDRDERFRSAFDTAPMAMLMVAADGSGPGRVLRVNEAMTRLTGWSADELVGRDYRSLTDDGPVGGSPTEGLAGDGFADLVEGRAHRVGVQRRYLRADGGHVWGACSASLVRPRTGEPYLMVLIEDVTARRAAEEVLTHRALHDPLTGVANRTLLLDRTEQALAGGGRSGDRVGLLFLDLDGFKEVNDTAGHAAGDELLRQVAQRLVDVVRPGDTVARLGGDEFTVLCPAVRPEDLDGLARRVLGVLREPYVLPDGAHVVSASVGVASAACDATAEGVLRAADAAMYEAKRSGKDRVAGTEAAGTAP